MDLKVIKSKLLANSSQYTYKKRCESIYIVHYFMFVRKQVFIFSSVETNFTTLVIILEKSAVFAKYFTKFDKWGWPSCIANMFCTAPHNFNWPIRCEWNLLVRKCACLIYIYSFVCLLFDSGHARALPSVKQIGSITSL